MATASQVVATLSRLLSIPHGRLIWARDQLRAARLLPNAQGQAVDLIPRQISALIIAALLGELGAYPQVVTRFMGLRNRHGTTLAEAIDGLQKSPGQLVRLDVNTDGTAAVVTDGDTTHYGEADFDAVSRIATVGGDKFKQLTEAIAGAPQLRAGRPSEGKKRR